MSLDWTLTLAALALGFGLLGLALMRAGRKLPDKVRVGRIKWEFVILLAGVVVFLAAVHAVNLLGLQTGRGPAY